MLSVDQALRLVLEKAAPLPPRSVDLDAALGCVLAEAVASDIDSPPHDKAVVDGYAVIAASITESRAELDVVEEVTAGTLPTQAVQPGCATRIMTGAPLPAGADAVVMVEHTEPAPGGRVRILQSPIQPGQNIMRRAASLARGQTVLSPGKLLRPMEIGLLAEVGRTQVQVGGRPRAAILATGNELVDAAVVPGPSQIRNSNGPLLAAWVRHVGADPIDLGIAKDTAADLEARISAGLAAEVLLLSGGVSAGVLDLVPQVLTRLGVEPVFHKVNLKPGKPLWFGVKRPAGENRSTLVFGLPGNPVSTLVCSELFVRPAVQQLRGLPPTGLPRLTARLTKTHHQRGDRPTFWPSVLERAEHATVTPLSWQGSGDLHSLTQANALAYFPPGSRIFTRGETIEVLRLE